MQLANQGLGQGPDTLALMSSQSLVYRELIGPVIVVVVIFRIWSRNESVSSRPSSTQRTDMKR